MIGVWATTPGSRTTITEAKPCDLVVRGAPTQGMSTRPLALASVHRKYIITPQVDKTTRMTDENDGPDLYSLLLFPRAHEELGQGPALLILLLQPGEHVDRTLRQFLSILNKDVVIMVTMLPY